MHSFLGKARGTEISLHFNIALSFFLKITPFLTVAEPKDIVCKKYDDQLSKGLKLFYMCFRIEKIDIRSSRSLAKLFGTIIAISGAMVFTFYQGPEIFQTIPSPDSHDQLLLSQPSKWVFGGLILLIGGIVIAIWNVLQVRFPKFTWIRRNSLAINFLIYTSSQQQQKNTRINKL